MGGVLWATEISASHHMWGFRCLYRGVGGYILVGTAQCGVDKKIRGFGVELNGIMGFVV